MKDRPLQLGHGNVLGTLEDAAVREPATGVEQHELILPDARKPGHQAGTAEENPETILKPGKPLLGDDGLLIHQVPSQGRKHLALRHIHGVHDGDPLQFEIPGRQDLPEHLRFGEVLLDPHPFLFGQRP